MAVPVETSSQAQSSVSKHYQGSPPDYSRRGSRLRDTFARAREAGKMAALMKLGFVPHDSNAGDFLAGLFQQSDDQMRRSEGHKGTRDMFWTGVEGQ